jgi:cytochrome c biogenesis protein CcmG, thiol:disulfide interchange protein DsbE
MPFESASDDKAKPVTRRALLRGAATLAAAGPGVLLAPWAKANDLRVGRLAPPATLMTLDGARIDTRDLIGRVIILTFWATWCGPCRAELPLLSAYAEEHASRELSVLGFTLDPAENLPKVRHVAQTLSFPVGLLDHSSLPGYGRIWRIPVNFTIDRQGRLADDGWKDKEATWTAERLQRIVTPLLNDSSKERGG